MILWNPGASNALKLPGSCWEHAPGNISFNSQSQLQLSVLRIDGLLELAVNFSDVPWAPEAQREPELD